jgi:hypothetical protein
VTVTNSAKRDVATDTLVEFIPGVGIVRQLRVNTTDGEMTIRIEMILAPK